MKNSSDPHRQSNPRVSGLWRNASTNCTTTVPSCDGYWSQFDYFSIYSCAKLYRNLQFWSWNTTDNKNFYLEQKTLAMSISQTEERFFARKAWCRVPANAFIWKCCWSQASVEGILWIPRLEINETSDSEIFFLTWPWTAYICAWSVSKFDRVDEPGCNEQSKQNLLVVCSAFHFMLRKSECHVASRDGSFQFFRKQ